VIFKNLPPVNPDEGAVSDLPGGGWNQHKAEVSALNNTVPGEQGEIMNRDQVNRNASVGAALGTLMLGAAPGVAGVGANLLGRGIGAYEGQKLGGTAGNAVGAPDAGRVLGGVAGFLSPEILGTALKAVVKSAGLPGLLRVLTRGAAEASAPAVAETAAPAAAVGTGIEGQLAGRKVVGVGSDVEDTIRKILQFAPRVAEEAAPAAAEAAPAATKVAGKVGEKLWFVVKNGKPSGMPITPDQARAAARAGQDVTWIRNVFGN